MGTSIGKRFYPGGKKVLLPTSPRTNGAGQYFSSHEIRGIMYYKKEKVPFPGSVGKSARAIRRERRPLSKKSVPFSGGKGGRLFSSGKRGKLFGRGEAFSQRLFLSA